MMKLNYQKIREEILQSAHVDEADNSVLLGGLSLEVILKEAIQAEYDALCPKPSEFPEGFSWYAIETYGHTYFMKVKPNLYDYCWIQVHEVNASVKAHKVVKIPFGIDWRLCRYSLEDAKRIHGEDE
jgi:hypothetical protein